MKTIKAQLKLDIASNSSILSGDHVFFSAPSLHQVQASEQDEQDPLCVVCLSNPTGSICWSMLPVLALSTAEA